MSTVTIKHEVRLSKSGVSTLVRARHPSTEQVTAVYVPESGALSVRTKSGDIWNVKQIGDNYETVQ
jgi:hypothetical protein